MVQQMQLTHNIEVIVMSQPTVEWGLMGQPTGQVQMDYQSADSGVVGEWVTLVGLWGF